MEYAIWCPEWGLPEDAADKYAGGVEAEHVLVGAWLKKRGFSTGVSPVVFVRASILRCGDTGFSRYVGSVSRWKMERVSLGLFRKNRRRFPGLSERGARSFEIFLLEEKEGSSRVRDCARAGGRGPGRAGSRAGGRGPGAGSRAGGRGRGQGTGT